MSTIKQFCDKNWKCLCIKLVVFFFVLTKDQNSNSGLNSADQAENIMWYSLNAINCGIVAVIQKSGT